MCGHVERGSLGKIKEVWHGYGVHKPKEARHKSRHSKCMRNSDIIWRLEFQSQQSGVSM